MLVQSIFSSLKANLPDPCHTQVQNIIKKQASSVKYLEGRPLSNKQSSQEQDLIVSFAFLISNKKFFSSKLFNVFHVDNLRVFRDAGEKGRKCESFRLGMSAGPRLMLAVFGTLVVVLYSSWLVLVVGGAVEVICLKFVA